jgi:iron(III) transport system permease protein
MEASHISGGGDGRTFLRISLPLMLPDLIAGWSLLFLWMLGELNASIILAGTSNPVLGEQMYLLYFQGYFGKLAALAIIVTIISVIVLLGANLLARRLRGGRLRPGAV